MGNLAGLAAVAQIGGATATAGNAYSQYSSSLASSKYQAGVLNQNAQFATTQGDQAMERGAFEAAQRGLRAGQVIGAQKAAIAGSAVDASTGSAAKLGEDTRAAAGVDQETIMNNAALQRWGYGIEAAGYRSQARMAKIGGRFAARSALAGGAAGLGKDALAFDYYASKAGWFDSEQPLYMKPPAGKNMSDPRNR